MLLLRVLGEIAETAVRHASVDNNSNWRDRLFTVNN
jgi:hypothetical protein